MIVYLLIKKRCLKVGAVVMPILVFVPVFGFGIWIVEEISKRRNTNAKASVDLTEFKIKDVKYRRIHMEQGENQKITVPLEEAILINDKEVRHKLMLEILNKNPVDHIDLLQNTKLSDDVELTHYATTSIMEIQSEFELNLQKLSEQNRRNPQDIRLLEEYKDELKRYVESDLISGNVLMIYREQLVAVLQELLELEPEKKENHRDFVDNQLEMKQYVGIERHLAWMKEKWQQEAFVYQLYVKYYFSVGQGKRIAEVLKEMKHNNIYLTKQQKEWFRFWSQEEA